MPYVNAVPLIAQFETEPDSPVLVHYDVPSRLPGLLESGQAQAILVSSIDALRTPGRRIASGVCIGSRSAVRSVRLFSKVPFGEICTLALDQSSMTSNALAQILLAELHGSHPVLSSLPPVQAEMLAQCDACILIGDIGMAGSSEGLHVMDLGEAWLQLTGLPFVWAAWIGGEGLTDKLAKQLQNALQWTELHAPLSPHRTACLALAVERSGWSLDLAEDYLTRTMTFFMDETMVRGLEEFRAKLLAHGLISELPAPELVGLR